MKKIIFISVLFFASTQISFSQSDRWVYAGFINEQTLYIDSKSIKVNSDKTMYDVWCKSIWGNNRITKTHYQFYCGVRKANYLSSTTEGGNSDYDPLYDIDITPDTPIEVLYYYICKN